MRGADGIGDGPIGDSAYRWSQRWRSGVIEAILAPYLGDGRVIVETSSASVGWGATTSLAQLLYGFAANAVKYGAISDPGAILIAIVDGIDTIVADRCERGGAEENGEQGSGPTYFALLCAVSGGTADQAAGSRTRRDD